MSTETDELAARARQEGFDSPQSTIRVVREDETSRPDLPWIHAPGQGHRHLDVALELGKSPAVEGIYRTPWGDAAMFVNDRGKIEEMPPVVFPTFIEKRVITYVDSFTKRGSIKEPKTISQQDAAMITRCQEFLSLLPELRRVNQTPQPVMRTDGTIEMLRPGYDEQACILTLNSGIDFDPDFALAAGCETLRELHAEFPFEGESSFSAHLVAMTAIFAPDLAPNAKRMGTLYRSNQSRAGKGLLAAISVAAPHGFIEIQPAAADDAEFRKTLDAENLNQSSYVFFDEIQDRLGSRILQAFATARIWSGRLMGGQRRFSAPQTAVVIGAGRNIDFNQDSAGRFLLVDLFVSEADPQTRRIKHVLEESHLASPETRADIGSALWALIRAWDQAGRPGPSGTFAGYESFCRIYGGIIEHAGFANPMVSQTSRVDPDYCDMLSLLAELRRRMNGENQAEFEFQEIVNIAHEQALFSRKLEGRPGRETDKDGTVIGPRFELTSRGDSRFGKFLRTQRALDFHLPDNAIARFQREGTRGHRRFLVTIEL